MRKTKAITVVHPDSRIRIALRKVLETHGCAVATDHTCSDLMSGKSDVRPDLILVDRSLLDHEGLDILSQLNQKWDETEIIFLPEGMSGGSGTLAFESQLLRIVDRLLGMRTTREILSI